MFRPINRVFKRKQLKLQSILNIFAYLHKYVNQLGNICYQLVA